MIYLTKGQSNSLVLNINNNSRDTFTGYTLQFTHVMSKEQKTYSIDKLNPAQYSENIRYCEIILPLDTDDLNYQGQYVLNIFGESGTIKVFNGMVYLNGPDETNPFTQYISSNEDNSNYIYIQD